MIILAIAEGYYSNGLSLLYYIFKVYEIWLHTKTDGYNNQISRFCEGC